MTGLEELRAELQRLLAAGRKMTDPEVVRVSQELDRVVNEEMRKAAPLRSGPKRNNTSESQSSRNQ